MFADLIQIAGLWFLAAIALEAFAIFVEQAGAARSPEDDHRRHRAVSLLAFLLALATPSLLIAHGFFATEAQDQSLRAIAMAAPIAAVLLGSLLGAMFGAIAQGAAPTMRKLALPLDLAAFALAIYAALPSLRTLIADAQNGGVS